MLSLTPALRVQLKSPLGFLIRGSFDKTMRELKRLVERETPSKIISVGDVVSNNMVNHNILPQVLVVDNKVMRETITPIPTVFEKTLHLKNPPGTITEEAWTVMEKAMQQAQQTRVLVDGEEDLLALLAVLYAPEGSFVVYGQPHEGIVVIKVDKQSKEKMRKIIKEMNVVST